MCGRFSQFKEFREIRLRFDPDQLGADWDESLFLQPRYNIAPSQMVPVIVREGSKQRRLKSWGAHKGTGYFLASTSSGSERKALKTPTIFPIPIYSPRKSSMISKPPSNNSAKLRRTWEGRE